MALSINLPSGEPLMRAWAEKRLLQELQALQLVRARGGNALLSNLNGLRTAAAGAAGVAAGEAGCWR